MQLFTLCLGGSGLWFASYHFGVTKLLEHNSSIILRRKRMSLRVSSVQLKRISETNRKVFLTACPVVSRAHPVTALRSSGALSLWVSVVLACLSGGPALLDGDSVAQTARVVC